MRASQLNSILELSCAYSHFASACVPGGSAMFSREFHDVTASHRDYLKGLPDGPVLSSFFSSHFPTLAYGGFLINSTSSPATCLFNGKDYFPGRDTVYPALNFSVRAGEPEGDLLAASTRAVWAKSGLPIVEWKDLPSYRQCLGVLGPRFDASFGSVPAPP